MSNGVIGRGRYSGRNRTRKTFIYIVVVGEGIGREGASGQRHATTYQQRHLQRGISFYKPRRSSCGIRAEYQHRPLHAVVHSEAADDGDDDEGGNLFR